MSDLRAVVRETLVANLFDGDDEGFLSAPLREHVDDITDVVMESVLDAFLASPQAAEELARARHRACVMVTTQHAWDAHLDHAKADLAAWQKVRHPEEAG